MRDSISRMQSERDRMDQRLGALEIAVAEERSARATGRSAPPAPTPPAQVVMLGVPEGALESDDPEDAAARPEIKVVGSAGGARQTRGRKLEIAPAGDPPSALDPDAKKSYDAALALVNAKEYDRALDALSGFLVKWPDHPYAENAHYWRGEVYYAQGETLRASEQFEAVLARFGGGQKAADALLKLGMCHDRLGAPERAREAWARLRRDHPRSEAARKIPELRPGASSKGPKESP
jgi:tol-pal system protein YbgF